jgi:hypothetical protein
MVADLDSAGRCIGAGSSVAEGAIVNNDDGGVGRECGMAQGVWIGPAECK